MMIYVRRIFLGVDHKKLIILLKYNAYLNAISIIIKVFRLGMCCKISKMREKTRTVLHYIPNSQQSYYVKMSTKKG